MKITFSHVAVLWMVLFLNLFATTFQVQAATSDEEILKNLNIEIAAAEDRGDRKWLENILAPELSFRRASGKIVGREQFLKDVKSRPSSVTRIESIKFYGRDRAVVTAIVNLKIDGKDAAFHNVRLFVRDGATWKLLGWANETSP